jgi:shikimate dehydrogenase
MNATDPLRDLTMLPRAITKEAALRDEPRLLVGLIGAGIQRSQSPALHEQESRHHGLRLHYQLIDLDNTPAGAAALPALLDAARTIGFAGLNITYPCKQAIMPLLDEVSEAAQEIGAVNTVVIRDGRLIGHNTDAPGWRHAFTQALPGADLSRVVLLGAGGAGAAVGHAVLQAGAQRLIVIDTQLARAVDLAHRLQRRFGSDAVAVCEDLDASLRVASGLIHATPTGMSRHPGLPLEPRLLRPGLWVSEVVYVPLETELLKAARAAGCATVDGGGMAVEQAAGAFELFTGRVPNVPRMQAHWQALLHRAANPLKAPAP